MDAAYIQNSIAKLKEDIFMHVRHRALQKYTGQPIVNDNQLFFMLLPLFNDENWTTEHYEAAITTGIISSALFAHEEILEHDASSQQQQLKVLAGDYYSGRYYEILAQSGNVSFIRFLSEGVIKRCEYQIRTYEDQQYSFENWLQVLTVIESELTKKFYELYQFEQYIPILQKALLLRRLQAELAALKSSIQTSLLKAIAASVHHQYPNSTLENVLQHQIQSLTIELEELLTYSTLKEEVITVILHLFKSEANESLYN